MEAYMVASLGGYKYAKLIYQQKYSAKLFCQEDWQDTVGAAKCEGWAASRHTGDSRTIFRAATNAAQMELRRWLYPRLSSPQPFEDRPLLPALAIARVLYRRLRKKGARGRRSAVLKAYIVQQKCQGRTCGEIAIQLEATKYRTNEASVRRHWNSAYGLIFGVSRGNITR